MTPDRRLLGLVCAAFGGTAGGKYLYWVWTPIWWPPWLVTAAADVMVVPAGLSMAVRSCR